MEGPSKRRARRAARACALFGSLAVLTQVPDELLVSVGGLVSVLGALFLLMAAAGAASANLERDVVRGASRFGQYALPALLLGGVAILSGGSLAVVALREKWSWPGNVAAASFVLFCMTWAVGCHLTRLTAEHTNALGWPLTSPRLFANLDGATRIFVAAALGWAPAATGAGVGADFVVQVLVPLVILRLWSRPTKPWKPLIEVDLETAVASAIQSGVTDLRMSSAGVADHELDPKALEWRRSIDARTSALLERAGYYLIAARVGARVRGVRASRVARVANVLAWVVLVAYLGAALIGLAVALILEPDTSRKVLWGGLLICLVGLVLRIWSGPSPIVRASDVVGAKVQALAEPPVEP